MCHGMMMRSAAQMESNPQDSALSAAWRRVSGVAARPEIGRKTPVFVVWLRSKECGQWLKY